MSTRTVIYKGMVIAARLAAFYDDLRDKRLESAIALVHQRFSTNTFPLVGAGAPVPLPGP